VRYIEKAAFTWEREGVFTLEKAEAYLKNLESKKSARSKVKAVLQIKDREFSETEKRYADGWIIMGFEPEAIAIAYDRTVTKTGKLSWAYMDSIIKNWHSKKLHTVQQILDKDSMRGKNATQADMNRSGQKHGEPSRDEMDRMQRLLDRIKEEDKE
jgi:DnaD/phage-associated family protein